MGCDLKGKVAIVTGSSRGIGAAIATKLASEGANVAINYNNNSTLAESLAKSLTSQGYEIIAVQGDISNPVQAKLLVDTVVEKWGKIDILVNNAGVNKDKLLIRMSVEDWDEVINVNLKGTFLCTKLVVPFLIKQKSGRIINISSVVGLSGNPGQTNYAASKAGLVGFTKALAREVASRNITVNALAPGFIVSGGMVDELSEESKSVILQRIPMGRFGTVEEVANTCAFLCCEEAGYITGQVITMDGGMIA
ncbi:MAG TPA: 3-oxoacyl-[acyl-carrier-protein] reductase [Dehalococcoidia bacterium]|nr:3-oxoacyl-[acyl-carrier-protein] reductase [Dehalococcoidia bacterium]|tara:strand:+ start:180 stop:932 length:753 start_codon:yes stop_codon:yes gene_type:complete